MGDAVTSSLGLVAYVAMFAAVAICFLLANLVIGRIVRPQNPQPEKLEIYECGEPAVGTSFVQFDPRFYVVALVFLIFDVEVALVFPWATVFGKAAHLAHAAPVQLVEEASAGAVALTPQARGLHAELGVRRATVPAVVPASLRGRVSAEADAGARAADIIRGGAQQLVAVALLDMAVFFSVLLVGFAYVWVRGDLDWVRPRYPRHDAEVVLQVGILQEA